MKKLYQKIIVSILSLAVMGTVCAIAPVMAEASTEEPTEMYFDNTYQAWWTAFPGNELVYEKSAGISTGTTAINTEERHRNIAYFGEIGTTRPKAYTFEATDAYLLINLPQKENYELKTVEVTTSHGADTYQRPFDYYYSADGTQWTKVETTTYTNKYVATTQYQYYYTFCETIKVPSTATKFKIIRNSNTVTEKSYIGKYPTVMGFELGYMPVATSDVLQFSASCDTKMIDLFASGIIADGACDWHSVSYDYDSDGTAENGFGPATGKSITINAVDGYKITSMSGKFYSNSASNKVKITLGEVNKTVSWPLEIGTTAFNVSNEEGAATLVITDTSTYDTHCLYDIVITMEKIKLETSIDSAVDDGTAVTATATVSNLDLAEDASMELIVAGYDGTRFMGAQTKTVTKADEDGTDSLTATLPTGTKSVKVFLWKDLDTLESVLAPIEAAVTTAVAE